MEPTVVAQTAVQLWGPIGALLVIVIGVMMFGFFKSLKWLASRDDVRNEQFMVNSEKILILTEACKAALINNTQAMHDITNNMQHVVTRVEKVENIVSDYFVIKKVKKKAA